MWILIGKSVSRGLFVILADLVYFFILVVSEVSCFRHYRFVIFVHVIAKADFAGATLDFELRLIL